MIEKRERRRRDGTTLLRLADALARRARRRAQQDLRSRRPTPARSRPSCARSSAAAPWPTSTPARETLAEFVEEWWLVYAGPNLERSTLRVYAQLWNGHALPRLGQLRLRDLTPQVVARFRAELEAAGVGDRGDPQDDDDAPGRPAAGGRVGPRPDQRRQAHAQAAEAAPAGGPGDPAVADRGDAGDVCSARAGCGTRRCSWCSATPACARRRRSRSSGATCASARCWSSARSATGSSRRSRTAASRGRSSCSRRCARISMRGGAATELAADGADLPGGLGRLLARDGLAELAQADLQADG